MGPIYVYTLTINGLTPLIDVCTQLTLLKLKSLMDTGLIFMPKDGSKVKSNAKTI